MARLTALKVLGVDGFDIAYTVNINMSDVDVSPEILMMHLVVWLNQYDVDRESKGLEPPTFATQKLDNGRFELWLRIDVKESYSLEERKWACGNKATFAMIVSVILHWQQLKVNSHLLSLLFLPESSLNAVNEP